MATQWPHVQDDTLHGSRGDALRSRATHASKLQMTRALQLAALQSFACAAASKRGCFLPRLQRCGRRDNRNRSPRSIRSIAMKRLFDSLSRWVQSLGGRKLGYIYTY
ncbi:hypothetical protein [Xanthomonas sacchari]|uniref:hypothetical protein n=1 Tax=Xanthomonas sacchari TaxID=56458 RepID=UPI0012DFFA35|nr:hypothetical protein [Xanthomonas sacchari]